MVRRAVNIFAKLPGARTLSVRLRRCGVAVAAALALVVVPSVAVPAQEASEQALKVAFIFNFAKFTTWPAAAFSDPAAPVTVCVVGKHDFGEAFQSIEGKSVGGRSVAVKYLTSYKSKDQCQVVYVASSEKSRLAKIVKVATETHALIVSDTDGFVDGGTIINMVRRGDDRIGFEINARVAGESGLKLSSKLLNLAERVVN
jgi:YfiR/HmsC-like